MPPLETGMPVHNRNKLEAFPLTKGFSLLELLVVLVIIGIIISVATLAIGGESKNLKIKSAGRIFVDKLTLAEEMAVLKSKLYGLVIEKQGYYFLQWQAHAHKGQWQRIHSPASLNYTAWPEGTQISLTPNLNQNKPDIIINNSGEISAFKLTLNSHSPQYTIISNGSGALIQRKH